MFWLLFGAFMYLMIKNQWDLQGVKKDVRKIARAVKKALIGAGKSIQAAAQEAQKQKAAKAAPTGACPLMASSSAPKDAGAAIPHPSGRNEAKISIGIPRIRLPVSFWAATRT